MIILGTTGTIFGTIFETILGETFWVIFWTIFRIVFGDTFQNYFNYAIFRIQILAFILFSFELGHTVCSYILFCFSGLSKGHQQFTWEEGKIFSAKLVCFENFLALNCLPVESSQEVLLNWEKMFNFEA